MPEGPETQRQVDDLSSVLVGKKLTQVYFYHSQPDEFRGRLSKSRVQSIIPYGKAIVINFKNKPSLLQSFTKTHGIFSHLDGLSLDTMVCGRGGERILSY